MYVSITKISKLTSIVDGEIVVVVDFHYTDDTALLDNENTTSKQAKAREVQLNATRHRKGGDHLVMVVRGYLRYRSTVE